MIIGYDGSRAFISSKTGTENYSYQLLKTLASIDRSNQYVVYLRPDILHRVDNWPGNFQFSIINFQFLWTQGGLALQTFKDNLDVLFVPAHTLPIIRRPGLKTVVTVHDLGSEYLPYMHQLKQRLYLSIMQKYQLKTATKIIAVSKATKMDLVKRIGIRSDKIEVVHEGYDKKLFKPHYNLKPKTYYLFVGTVQPRKNLERVIKAFSKFDSDEKLVIVGQKGWMSEEIYKLPEKLRIESRIKFLGYVPEKDLPALYSGAIALVFPSLFEGFGLPILEAQACGCPVITSNLSSMPEVGGKGAIYVNPYSVEGIIRGIREIGEMRKKLIKAGFENIKRFSWEKCARETLKVLESI